MFHKIFSHSSISKYLWWHRVCYLLFLSDRVQLRMSGKKLPCESEHKQYDNIYIINIRVLMPKIYVKAELYMYKMVFQFPQTYFATKWTQKQLKNYSLSWLFQWLRYLSQSRSTIWPLYNNHVTSAGYSNGQVLHLTQPRYNKGLRD